MASKKISGEDVGNVLGVGAFTTSREVTPSDPIEPTPMKLPIEQIIAYDKNPRRSKNPEYESILESLRANGQEEALTITRRPGSEQYMIKRGGNTRLEIMNMLYHEAGDERFGIIECLFMPWTSESDCIVGHLNENTTQGRMTLIDKARGYREFKQAYEEEHGGELGQRKLASLLKEKGASVSQPLLSVMTYALDVLEPAIPLTLRAGLGKPQIEKLKRLHQIFERLAGAHNLFEPSMRETQILAEFHHLLSIHDGDDWDMEIVQHDFTQMMSKHLDQADKDRLRYDIDRCQSTDPWKVDLISTEPLDLNFPDDTGSQPSSQSDSRSKPTAAPSPAKSQDGEQGGQPQGSKPTQEQTETSTTKQEQSTPATRTSQPQAPASAVGGNDELSAHDIQPPQAVFTAGQFDLKSMRSRIYTLALQFAQAAGVPQKCVLPWNYGYGFVMDVPKQPLADVFTPQQIELLRSRPESVLHRFVQDRDGGQSTFAWWLLWSCQGALDYRQEQPIPGYHKMPECQMKTLLEQVYNPDDKQNWYKLGHSAFYHITLQTGGPRYVIDFGMAHSYVKPHNTMKYINVLEARTQLQAYAEDNGINLWEVKS